MKPIPVQMLRQTVRLTVPVAVDAQQTVTDAECYYIHRVCLQTTNATLKTDSNTTTETRATLFVDARLSYPRLDWFRMKQQADAAGADMRINEDGRLYTVTNVRLLMDDHARLHHYEVELI